MFNQWLYLVKKTFLFYYNFDQKLTIKHFLKLALMNFSKNVLHLSIIKSFLTNN